jgi:outer membrane lipoprotein-sorting protein
LNIALAAVVTLSAISTRAQTADDIIAKNIQARGGMEKLKSVETLRTISSYRFGRGTRVIYVQENKRPNKIREETIVQGTARVEAYDGKTGWHVSPFQGRKDPELLSEDDLKPLLEDADIDGQLIDYKQKGYAAELLGHDSVEGTDCYKIKLTMTNGTVLYYYLDADSNLELKVETHRMIRGAVEESETYFGDYEKVNGIYFPFAIESAEKGSPNRIAYTVEKVEINQPLDDGRFALPATPAKAPARSGAGN